MLLATMRDKEEAALRSFFRPSDIFVPAIPAWVSDDLCRYWETLGFALHYFPSLTVTEEHSASWPQPPSPIFFRELRRGKLSASAANLGGSWALIDGREKPEQSRAWISRHEARFLGTAFAEWCRRKLARASHQTYPHECFGEVLVATGSATRFCLNFTSARSSLTGIAKVLRLSPATLRFPRYLEYVVLANLFFPQWTATRTWEWLEDVHGKGQRLTTGSRSVRILGWDPENHWSTILGFRPLAELHER